MDLLSLNKFKVTSTLTCKLPANLKAEFILLASDQGLNVNQLLSVLVDAAVKKTHEQELDAFKKKIDDLEKQVANEQSENVRIKKNAATLGHQCENLLSEFDLKAKEMKALQSSLEQAQTDLKKSSQEIEQLKSILTSWKSANELCDNNQKKIQKRLTATEEKLKNKEQEVLIVLNKNKEVLEKLKAREKEADFSIRSWVWEIVNEFPTEISQVVVA